MTVTADTPILHHYDTSPFSEKVRVMFGIKALAWGSVHIPNIMPKPDFTPLTGGYRRTPALQIGADVYCDTQVILAELEARSPSPPTIMGLDWAINWWADRLFFQTTVPVIFGTIGDKVPEAFIKDRTELSGRPFDMAAMQGAVEPLKQQWRAQAGWIETALSASPGGWLSGAAPGLADAAAYMNIWFLTGTLPHFLEALTAGMPHLAAWRGNLAALGHGRPEELDGTAALAIAKAAQPAPPPPHDPHDPLGAARGEAVFVMADDYGRDRVTGRLVAANPERVVIAREHEATGPVHVHFPRAGYVAGKA